MNKRQKKKLYKKLHGYNPPKPEKRPKYKPGIYVRVEDARLKTIYPHIRPETRNRISELMEKLDGKTQKAVIQILSTAKRAAENLAEIALHHILPCAQGGMLDLMAEKYGLIRKQHECDDTLRRRILGEKEPPCIITAEALTRQRAAGRRKKRNYHTRNRRKRK